MVGRAKKCKLNKERLRAINMKKLIIVCVFFPCLCCTKLASREVNSPWINCMIESKLSVNMMIDSGSDINAMSEDDWLSLLSGHIEGKIELSDLKWGNGKRTVLAFATPTPLQVECVFSAWISLKAKAERRIFANFFVIRGAKRSLLSRQTAVALNVLRLGKEVNSCTMKPLDAPSDERFPSIPGEAIHFDIDHSVTPTKNAYYNVPAAFREQARERLDKMQRQGITEDVVRAPRWISGMSLVPKGKDDFRLVVNMKGPNRAIRRSFHRLPTIEDMKVMLVGAAWFTKLDISSAFHHLELDDDSRELTTFQTESGMRRFTRLVFGVNCAPEIFQRTMERLLAGISNVIVYIDDVLIYASSEVELETTTAKVLKVLRENNLTLNEGKCEFRRQELKFLGHQLSAKGFAIDDGKVRDVRNFVQPLNKTDLRSFLGLAAYLSDYVSNFADLVHPLWEVVKSQPFAWTDTAEAAFQETKKRIADCTIKLAFFEEGAPTVLYTDASPHALGAVLTQEKENQSPRIISFASKLLSKTEKAYPQIQKEALGVVWGVERFYYYLLGRRFTIKTDASGLSFIFNRESTTCKRALNRAEGWALRLNIYDYEIEWIKGKANIADPSSRLCSQPAELLDQIQVCTLSTRETINTTNARCLPMELVKSKTRNDGEMQGVIEAMESGIWPEELKRYEKVASELRMIDGALVRMGAVVVPKDLRSEALRLGHLGHPGVSAMKSVMRECVWWPRMPTEIEEFVTTCGGCQLAARAERPVPMLSTMLPQAPWDKIALDFNGPHAALGGKSILLVVDYFSRYLVAEFVKSTDYGSIEGMMSALFKTFGNPKEARTDNGPPFNGSEWKKFCESRNIKTEFSTPGHPQQNGLVERYMQLCNKAVTIAVETASNCEIALADAVAAHNSAVQRTTSIAPEVLIFGRRLRRNLPRLGDAAVTIDLKALKQRDSGEKTKTRERENRKRQAKPTAIEIGDKVLLKRQQKSKDQTPFAPMQYEVVAADRGDMTIKGPDGRLTKRNIVQLKKLNIRGEDGEANSKGDKSPPVMCRPKRARKSPTYLADYAHNVENNEMND